MLAIRVQFLHGVLRAGSADDVAMTGLDDPGEWPPSPARLFSALVAGGGTSDRCAIGDGSELEVLERADPPQIIADADADVLRSPLRPRFVVVDDCYVEGKTRQTQAVHEYLARTSAAVRPGTRMAPKRAEVAYVWRDLDLSPEQFDSIILRAARVGYLGCSDSPVRLTVSTDTCPDDAGRRWMAEDSGAHTMPVPYPGFTSALDNAFAQWLTGPVRRAWIQTPRARYAAPGDGLARPAISPTVLWFLLGRSVSMRFALALTETLRAATLDLYARFADEDVPAVLHGHGFADSGRNHAQFLALPDVGLPNSSGRIHGVAVWLPTDTPPEASTKLRLALAHLDTLVRPGWFDVAVHPHGGQRRPWAGSPSRWAGPARRWVAALPVVHERWTSSGPGREEFERWFHHAGFECRVLACQNSAAPLLHGSARLRPEQVHRQGRSQHPYSFIEVLLDREIQGPVAIGRGRQFGMGLMAPED